MHLPQDQIIIAFNVILNDYPSILTENSVGDEGVYLKTLSPRKEIRSLIAEVIKRSCSSKPKDILSLIVGTKHINESLNLSVLPK